MENDQRPTITRINEFVDNKLIVGSSVTSATFPSKYRIYRNTTFLLREYFGRANKCIIGCIGKHFRFLDLRARGGEEMNAIGSKPPPKKEKKGDDDGHAPKSNKHRGGERKKREGGGREPTTHHYPISLRNATRRDPEALLLLYNRDYRGLIYFSFLYPPFPFVTQREKKRLFDRKNSRGWEDGHLSFSSSGERQKCF